MLTEIRRYGLRKGWRAWWTWASVDDIETLTTTTRARRWVWVNIFRQRINPFAVRAAREDRDDG
jgi:hypothetical protein